MEDHSAGPTAGQWSGRNASLGETRKGGATIRLYHCEPETIIAVGRRRVYGHTSRPQANETDPKEQPMPTVFEKDGYRFFFYSNEHRPIHVHVRYGDGEAVFNVEDEVALRESQSMKVGDLSKAQALAEENRELIVEKWHEHLG